MPPLLAIRFPSSRQNIISSSNLESLPNLPSQQLCESSSLWRLPSCVRGASGLEFAIDEDGYSYRLVEKKRVSSIPLENGTGILLPNGPPGREKFLWQDWMSRFRDSKWVIPSSFYPLIRHRSRKVLWAMRDFLLMPSHYCLSVTVGVAKVKPC